MHQAERKPQKRTLETRKKIIATTEKLIARHGFDATNTNMIAREADISVGSIYTHFKDKYEIFLIILEQYRQKTYDFACDSIEKIITENNDPKTVLAWAIPALYHVNKINRNLSLELERFVLVDRRAAAIDRRQEKAEDELIKKLLVHFKSKILVTDIDAAATLINLQLRILFRHLLQIRSKAGEKALLNAFIEMLSHSIRE